MERFWRRVKKTRGCWLWLGARNWAGYGVLMETAAEQPNRNNRKKIRAHRISYEFHFGPIPKGLVICHRCDNPQCVKPDHLFAGTMGDNMRDMDLKGRRAVGKEVSRPGETNPRAKLNKKSVNQIRKKYKTGKVTMLALANIYKVNRSTIGRIINNKGWKIRC